MTSVADPAAGDDAAFAALVDEAPPRDLLAEMDIASGHEVLDIASATGNVARRAAAAGAHVVFAPERFERLPFDDGRFDRVLSAFGVQFAPRHDVVAAELVRVCRPRGRVGLVNWTPEGQVGELLSIIARHRPPPRGLVSPPSLWGSEEHVRELFGDAVQLAFTRGLNPSRFPSAEAYARFMETHYGPMVEARERLTAEGRWDRCRREILAMVERRNVRSDGALEMYAEYLITTARRI